MKRVRASMALAAALMLSACAKPDSVLFVTNASFGVNLEGKPLNASIGYDRTEGYLAPSFPSGAAPPVIASIETGGGLLSPKVRQLYATGAAAEKAAGKPGAADGPSALEGKPLAKKMIFFGTTTSLGAKFSLDPAGAPEAFNFGYKRKEFSYIPLAETAPGAERYVYPSVLASIDTVTLASAEASNSGLESRQFFATGHAAEALASKTEEIFLRATRTALAGALTPAQRAQSVLTGDALFAAHAQNVDAVMAELAPGGTLDAAKLKELAAKATASGATVSSTITSQTTAAGLRAFLNVDLPAASALAGAL